MGVFGSLVARAWDGVAASRQGLVVVALMAWMSVPLTVVTVVGCGLLWAALLPFNRRIRRLSVEVSVDSGTVAAKAEECAYAIKLIKSCRTESYERDRYAVLAGALAEKQVRLSDLRNGTGGLTLIGFVGVLGATAWMAFGAVMLAGFGILLLRLYPCLTKLIEARTALATMAGHLAAVAEFMVPQVPQLTDWAEREAEREKKVKYFPKGVPDNQGIVTRDLQVFYSPSKPVLNGISVDIRLGEATALVGLTGSGKTTLLDTLAGLRHPQRGYLHLSSQKVGYVTQEPIMLCGSGAANIAYGETFAVPSDFFPRQDLDLILSRVPLFRDLGRAGSSISGGQRQLVALGRLSWGDPDVWLLDEPTSAMDAETEVAVVDFLLGKRVTDFSTHKRILLIATHKLSLAARFDRILVLHGGKIMQDGTHEQLVKEDGLDSPLWRLQEVAG